MKHILTSSRDAGAVSGRQSAKSGSSASTSVPIWMGVAAGAAIVLAAGVLVYLGVGKVGTEAALRLTARLAFLLFWPSYVGSALVIVFGTAFQPIKRRGRELGLAFAAVLAVHLVLIGWLCWIGSAPAVKVFVIFGVGVLFTSLLALFSIERLGRAAGPMGWWILRNIGMNYIAFDFALDFLGPLHKGSVLHLVAYLPFAVLAVLGPALRVIASLKLAAQGANGKRILNKVLN